MLEWTYRRKGAMKLQLSKNNKKHKKSKILKPLDTRYIKWDERDAPYKMRQEVVDYVRADLISLIIRSANASESGLSDLVKLIQEYTEVAQKLKSGKKPKAYESAVIFQNSLVNDLYEATKAEHLSQILRGRPITKRVATERRKLQELLSDDELKQRFADTLAENGEIDSGLPKDATTKEIISFYNQPLPEEIIRSLRLEDKGLDNIIKYDWINNSNKEPIPDENTIGLIMHMKMLTLVYRFVRLREIAFSKDDGLDPVLLFTSIIHIHGEDSSWIYNEAIKLLTGRSDDREVLFMELLTNDVPDSIEEVGGFDPEYYLELPIIQLLHQVGHHFLNEWDDDILAEIMAEEGNFDVIAEWIKRLYNTVIEVRAEIAENEDFVEEGCVVFESLANFYEEIDPDPLELALEFGNLVRLLAKHLVTLEYGDEITEDSDQFIELTEKFALELFEEDE